MAFKNFWVQYKIGNEANEAIIDSETFVIGRAPECDITINSDVVSRNHLRVSFEDGEIYLEDLGSTNGTFNGSLQLSPNKKVPYKSSKTLYIDADKSVVMRITVLKEKDEATDTFAPEDFELQKQKNALDHQKRKIQRELRKENYIRAAAESADNLFENLKFVAKSARFNKEKAIHETRRETEAMIAKARQEIEAYQAEVEAEMDKLIEESEQRAISMVGAAREQADTLKAKAREELNGVEEKAQRLLKKAEDKAMTTLAEANEKAKEVTKKANKNAKEIVDSSEKKAQQLRQEIVEKAEAKANEIIGDAHAKNRDLKDENEKLISDIAKAQSDKQKAEADNDKNQKDLADTLLKLQSAKVDFQEAENNLSALKVKVANLESRNKEAATFLESKIPELQNQVTELERNIEEHQEESSLLQEQILEAQKELEDSKKERDRLEAKRHREEGRLDELSEKIIEAENNLFRLNDIKQQRNSDVDREIADRKNRQKEAEDRAQEKIKKMLKNTEKEIDLNIKRAKEMAAKMLEEANADKLAIEKEVAALQEKSQKEIDLRRSNLEAELAAARDIFMSQFESKAEKMVSDAKAEAEEILSKAKAQAKALSNEERQQNEEDIRQIRAGVVRQLEDQKQKFEQEEQQRIQIRNLKLRKELNDVLRARISPFLKDNQQLEKVGTIIEKSVNAVMLDDVDDDFIEAESYSDIDPSLHQDKVKKFWMGAAVGLALMVLAFILLPYFKEAAVESGRNIAVLDKRDTEAKIEKAKKENDLFKAYEPEMSDTFHDNYTDRVLTTKGYVDFELDPVIRDKWILKLEDYMVHELRMSDTTLVPFIAQESNLIRELYEARQKINGNFSEEGIARMRKIEADFIKQLRRDIKKDSDFKKIMNFKKSFFKDNQ